MRNSYSTAKKLKKIIIFMSTRICIKLQLEFLFIEIWKIVAYMQRNKNEKDPPNERQERWINSLPSSSRKSIITSVPEASSSFHL